MMMMTILKVLSRRRATYAAILWNPVMMNIYHHSQKYSRKSDVYKLSSDEKESKSTEIVNDVNETESIILTHALEMSTL